VVRKRAPGAGRKPRGPIGEKTATLSTRITEETRKALDLAAREHGISLSQEVEIRLQSSLARDQREDVQALGEVLVLVLQLVERATGKKWLDDAFTSHALRVAITMLLNHFGPREPPVVPPGVEKAATAMPAPFAQQYSTPQGVGETEAGRVITMIESWTFHDIDKVQQAVSKVRDSGVPRAHAPYQWRDHWQLLKALGSGWKRNQEKDQ
jgi:hypothetical protein